MTPSRPWELAPEGCSGERAWETVRRLHATDRWSTFPRYAETAAHCEELLRSWGLAAERRAFPADGETLFGDWRMPLAWDVEEAVLEVVAPRARPLLRYRDTPQCLVMWSAPTPPDGTTAELVCLERGDAAELAERDVAGKVVLTPRHPIEIKAAAARAGAAGLLSDWTRAKDQPDVRQWINTWSDAPGGWAMHAHDRRLWGFMITPREGTALRDEARAAGTVTLRARVASRLYAGELSYVTGLLEGESSEEVLLCAHINEQGANDNAAGASTVLEAARSLASAVGRGELSRPRRSVRFLLMPESYGTIAFAVRNRETLGRTTVALNVDSGAGCYDHEDSLLDLYVNPHCCPNYVDAVLAGIVGGYYSAMGRPERWRLKRYTLAGDNVLCDPMIGVPHPWLAMGDGGDFWHNTGDVPERVDPRSLHDLTRITAAFAWFMASATEAEIQAFAMETRRSLPEPLRPLLRFPNDSFDPPRSAAVNGCATVPRRTLPGALTLDQVPPEQWGTLTSSPRWWGPELAAWWWTDGIRSVDEIAGLVEREFGRSPDLARFFEALHRLGYVTLKTG